MKKIASFSFILLCFNLGVIAQCKLFIDKDDFTSKVTISTEKIPIAKVKSVGSRNMRSDVDLSFFTKEDTVILVLTHSSKDGIVSAVREFYLKFDNDLVIKKDVVLSNGIFETSKVTYFYTRFKLTKEELSIFSKNKLTKTKIIFDNLNSSPIFESDLDEKFSSKLQIMSDCLLKELK